ncbi:hypothetical protein WR25_01526 [Diploscapter pachys]|uniref:Inward rectifier potassium channel C-terminal domain-containing protein n=1 Tax=Diploscapter pachys TaxID=2018661 RepID=A0A2A2J257_9BILA|nr:hypothetical protein WR25_01526 [Diploscapter pachys]
MIRKAACVALSPSVANLLAAQRMLDIEEPLVKSKKYPFFKTPKLGSRRIRNRLVQKQGICNISLKNVPKQRRKYFSDIFTTIIEMKWRWCLLYFSLSFLFSWTLFASLYYMIAQQHGDIINASNASWTPCIMNLNNPTTAFLFSFTTQTTIGYGFRYPTDECPVSILTMCLQFIYGVCIQTLMAGIIFSKLARPIKRAATLIFSKNAVICMRDGKLCLLFRVGDMRKSSLAEAHVRLQMIKRCVTYEGELLPFHQFDMDVGYDQGLDRVFVIWPITICHEIDERSPLYDISEDDLKSAKFEIIAILEGVVESVGSTTQARTSYLPSEILWGRRFEKLVHYKKENGQYNIDFGKFHNVYFVKTPSFSAKQMDELRDRGLFDESEYQMYPPADTRSLALLSDGQISPTGESRIIDAASNQIQILRHDSDEDDQVGEESMELVDLGIHHKCSVRSASPLPTMNQSQNLSLAPPQHKSSCVRRATPPMCANGQAPKKDKDGNVIQCLPGTSQYSVCGKSHTCYFTGLNYMCCPSNEPNPENMPSCPSPSLTVLDGNGMPVYCSPRTRQCPNFNMYCSDVGLAYICCEPPMIAEIIKDIEKDLVKVSATTQGPQSNVVRKKLKLPKILREVETSKTILRPLISNAVRVKPLIGSTAIAQTYLTCPKNSIEMLKADGTKILCQTDKQCKGFNSFCFGDLRQSICCEKFEFAASILGKDHQNEKPRKIEKINEKSEETMIMSADTDMAKFLERLPVMSPSTDNIKGGNIMTGSSFVANKLPFSPKSISVAMRRPLKPLPQTPTLATEEAPTTELPTPEPPTTMSKAEKSAMITLENIAKIIKKKTAAADRELTEFRRSMPNKFPSEIVTPMRINDGSIHKDDFMISNGNEFDSFAKGAPKINLNQNSEFPQLSEDLFPKPAETTTLKPQTLPPATFKWLETTTSPTSSTATERNRIHGVKSNPVDKDDSRFKFLEPQTIPPETRGIQSDEMRKQLAQRYLTNLLRNGWPYDEKFYMPDLDPMSPEERAELLRLRFIAAQI